MKRLLRPCNTLAVPLSLHETRAKESAKSQIPSVGTCSTPNRIAIGVLADDYRRKRNSQPLPVNFYIFKCLGALLPGAPARWL